MLREQDELQQDQDDAIGRAMLKNIQAIGPEFSLQIVKEEKGRPTITTATHRGWRRLIALVSGNQVPKIQ